MNKYSRINADIKTIAEELVNPTVNETKELLTVLKSEYDIEPAAIHQYPKCLSKSNCNKLMQL